MRRAALVAVASLLLVVGSCSLFHTDSVEFHPPGKSVPMSSIKMDEEWLSRVLQDHFDDTFGIKIHIVDIRLACKQKYVEVFVLKEATVPKSVDPAARPGDVELPP